MPHSAKTDPAKGALLKEALKNLRAARELLKEAGIEGDALRYLRLSIDRVQRKVSREQQRVMCKRP